MNTFSHAVVICTRSRKKSLIECLDSINANKGAMHVQIIIVLNGISEEEYREFSNDLKHKYNLKIEVLRSEPGLTHARNMALSYTSAELVTFLDDDVLLPGDFILKTEQYFEENMQINGASPRIKDLYINQSKRNRLLVRRNYGRVTGTCRNYWVPDLDETKFKRIDWLPGCCMTYRTKEIRDKRFSIELEKGPSGGYALGEDVDFSIRMGELGLIKDLSIEHKQAPSVRDSSRVMSQAIGRWHGYLIRNYPARVSFFKTISLDTFLFGYLILKALLFRMNAKNELMNKLIEINSLINELRDPILIEKNHRGK